jgi:hypothetical protein
MHRCKAFMPNRGIRIFAGPAATTHGTRIGGSSQHGGTEARSYTEFLYFSVGAVSSSVRRASTSWAATRPKLRAEDPRKRVGRVFRRIHTKNPPDPFFAIRGSSARSAPTARRRCGAPRLRTELHVQRMASWLRARRVFEFAFRGIDAAYATTRRLIRITAF